MKLSEETTARKTKAEPEEHSLAPLEQEYISGPLAQEIVGITSLELLRLRSGGGSRVAFSPTRRRSKKSHEWSFAALVRIQVLKKSRDYVRPNQRALVWRELTSTRIMEAYQCGLQKRFLHFWISQEAPLRTGFAHGDEEDRVTGLPKDIPAFIMNLTAIVHETHDQVTKKIRAGLLKEREEFEHLLPSVEADYRNAIKEAAELLERLERAKLAGTVSPKVAAEIEQGMRFGLRELAKREAEDRKRKRVYRKQN
jgi:hypothetical protein